MKITTAAATLAICCATDSALGAATVEIRRSEQDHEFKLDPLPRPATNDAATTATFTLVDGQASGGVANLARLHDGRLPTTPDDPGKNFFFQDGTPGGRIMVDLGKVVSIQTINSYSWHPNARAAQVYKLYAAKGDSSVFNSSPHRGSDPLTVGWLSIAKVDTRNQGVGGQIAASIADAQGTILGEYRYLLFEIEATDPHNSQSNTFYSEIDVVDAKGPPPMPVPPKVVKTYKGPGGYEYTIDFTIAPDMVKWTEQQLMPMVYEWYPKLGEMLPSAGYTQSQKVTMIFKDDMGGTPAYASGNTLSLSLPFFRAELHGQASGCVIHEMTHIVQSYGRANATHPHPAPIPGWVSEGIPDYIRWFVYEPQAKGAEITQGNFAQAKYNSSYRVSANFLNWVVQTYDKDLIRKLNDVARDGRYSEKVWQDSTQKTSEQLGQLWRDQNAMRLGIHE